MTMNVLQFAMPVAAGLGIGLFYFFGLRITLHLVQTARRPVALLLASFFIRTIIAAGLFVLIGGDSLRRFGLALLGFVLARLIVVSACALPRKGAPPRKEKDAV